jgi:hypothetical protein
MPGVPACWLPRWGPCRLRSVGGSATNGFSRPLSCVSWS